MNTRARLFVYIAAVFGLYAGLNAQEIMVPNGEVVGFRLLTRDQVNLEWDRTRFQEEPTLEAGQKFAEVTIRLNEKSSIGKRDYTLAGHQCLAIALNVGAFHPRTWVYENEPAGAQVRLLFIVSEADDRIGYTLTYNYSAPLSSVYKDDRARWVSQTVSTQAVAVEGGEAPAKDADGEAPAADGKAPARDGDGKAEESKPAPAAPEKKPAKEDDPWTGI